MVRFNKLRLKKLDQKVQRIKNGTLVRQKNCIEIETADKFIT